MRSSIQYSIAVEQELINDFVQRESGISVDTLSMRRFGQFDPDEPVSIPFVSTKFIIEQPPHQMPKVASASLPSSASMSPQHQYMLSGVPPLPSGRYKKHLSDPTQNNGQPVAAKSLTTSLSRSKSCGEGRSSEPSSELDMSTKVSTQRLGSGAPLIDKSNEDYTGENGFQPPKPSSAGDFKCCIYLPGFSSKKKPVQAVQIIHQTTTPSNPELNIYHSPDQNNINIAPTTQPSGMSRLSGMSRPSGMSRVPSLERFDCSMSTSSGLEHWDEATGSHYFDLPMELIQSCENETDSPVSAAFVFEKERKKGRRSSKRTSGKVSHETSSRRTNVDLRFSGSAKVSNGSSYPSSPSSGCISPKVRKARDELNAFIEAQTA